MGIPREHPQSYHTFMYSHLFSHIDISPPNIHMLDGNAPCLETECQAYEDEIKAHGGIELFLAGIGPDGHIAFNEPGSSMQSRTRVKTLAHDTVAANSRFFDNDVTKVPKMALTVGVQTILDAREVVAIITGAHKSAALQKCVEAGLNHMWPLSSLQLHPHPMIVVDEDATMELQVKTVKYFKSIEKVATALGLDQTYPSKNKKRDSVVAQDHRPREVQVHFPPTPDVDADSGVSSQDTRTTALPSRSQSPAFDAMSARFEYAGTSTLASTELSDELLLVPMGASVLG